MLIYGKTNTIFKVKKKFKKEEKKKKKERKLEREFSPEPGSCWF